MPVFAVVSRNRPRDPRRGAPIVHGSARVLGPRLADVGDWPHRARDGSRQSFTRRLQLPGRGVRHRCGCRVCPGALSLAGWAILFGGVADVFDGRIARARGMASRYGAFMDSTLDRFAEAFSFVGVTWYLSTTPWGAAISVLAISGSLLVSYTRARGEAVGVSGTGGVMQRAERLVLLALGALADSAVATRWGWPDGTVLTAAVTLIAVGSIGTAIYRTVSIARTLARQGDKPRP
ncbi:MAG: CDP-alcohol phosphatidyltransferase family protein [Acidobacteria bacterium]|nr:CDP-alcohol phosphatidyltransferase family protein [Acidobacteriota bacterium]